MLSSSERRALRAQSHRLKPTVMLGQHGLTPAVVARVNEALTTHELIKVRIRGVERDDRSSFVTDIAAQVEAEVVHTIGHILTLYRKNPEPVPQAPVKRTNRPQTTARGK